MTSWRASRKKANKNMTMIAIHDQVSLGGLGGKLKVYKCWTRIANIFLLWQRIWLFWCLPDLLSRYFKKKFGSFGALKRKILKKIHRDRRPTKIIKCDFKNEEAEDQSINFGGRNQLSFWLEWKSLQKYS